MFQTPIQQAALSSYLWDNERSEELLMYMRLYDLIRRIYYVKTGQWPEPQYVVQCMENFLSNPSYKSQFIEYIKNIEFPLQNTVNMIKL
jgi:hypothetical protein